MPPKNKITDLFSVSGLVAVITGGGSGLGLYAARALDANGAKAVYIIGRRESTLHEAAKSAVNGTIKPIVGDVSSKSDLERIVEQVKREEGFVNLLFANAGVSGSKDASAVAEVKTKGEESIADLQAALWKADPETYDRALEINCRAVYFTAIAFLGLLHEGNVKRNVAQDSQILITSSIAGFSRHLASSFSYSTSKAAVNHLAKMLSTFFAQRTLHIRVNVVAPGLYPSEMTTAKTSTMDKFGGIKGHQAFTDAHVMSAAESPAERTGSEEDFAGLVLFLASHAGAYLNGEMLVTDGGRLAQMPSVY